MSQPIRTARILAFTAAALLLTAAPPAFAIDFGDNSSQWSNDGECDDPRFAGPGMTQTPLLEEDILHDATDCEQAYNAGRLELDAAIGFGDDSSQWSNDSECDDPRFQGSAMATTLLDEDRGHDASDCRAAFNAGDITLVEASGTQEAVTENGIDFGTDGGSWTEDGECDDPRFVGPGASTIDDEEEIRNDATDCRAAYAAGTVMLKSDIVVPDVELGDNSSFWANNGECDDPRFAGLGMAQKLLQEDTLHDADDCRDALENGRVALAPSDASEIDFGSDGGEWPNDGECDDPRFVGPGRSVVSGLDEIKMDATDCRSLFEAGRIRLR